MLNDKNNNRATLTYLIFYFFLESGQNILKKLLESLNKPLEDGETLSDKSLGNNVVNCITLGVCILILICILLFNRKQCHFNRKKSNKKVNHIYKPNNYRQTFQFDLENEEEDIM